MQMSHLKIDANALCEWTFIDTYAYHFPHSLSLTMKITGIKQVFVRKGLILGSVKVR